MDKAHQAPGDGQDQERSGKRGGVPVKFAISNQGGHMSAPFEPEIVIWFARVDPRIDRVAAILQNNAAHALAPEAFAAWVGLIHPDDAAQRDHSLALALREQTPCRLEFRLGRDNGSHDRFGETVHPMFDDAGHCLGLVGICAQLLQGDGDEARSPLPGPRWDALIAALAHALRNPLAPLTISGNLLARGGLSASEAARAGEVVEAQARQIAAVVAELEQVAHLVDGQGRQEWQAQRLGALVDAAIDAVQPLIEAAQHEVLVQHVADPWVHADRAGLLQALTHLLRNAAQHTPAGGRVEITLVAERGAAEIRIRDNGCGIAPGALPRLFEPFRASLSTKRPHQGGLGLGLFVARRWVELHGGRLLASSAGEGSGALFTLRLPAADSAPQQPLPPLRHRVLLIEDQQDIVDSTVMALEYLGADVVAALTGADALRKAAEFLPSLVLIDIGLPDIDGHEVARQLRRLPQLAATTLIALSSWGDADMRARSAEAGMHEHLVKPLDIERLDLLLQRTPLPETC